MVQNKPRLIKLMVGNLCNCIVHEILSKAIDDELIRKHYNKELSISFDIASRYRKKINTVNRTLPESEEIKLRIRTKVSSELRKREELGYENIDFSIIDEIIDKFLKRLNLD